MIGASSCQTLSKPPLQCAGCLPASSDNTVGYSDETKMKISEGMIVTTEAVKPGIDTSEPRHLVLTVLILIAVIVAVSVRWWGLATQSLWWDEGYSLWISHFPLKDIWRGVQADTSPPLYYWLLHGWTRLFGISEISLRGMSALFETLSIPVFYLVAERVLEDKMATLVAVWLYALCAFQVEYAKDARMYGLLLFCSITSVYCLLVFLDKRSRIAFAGLVLSLAAGLYTHNMMFFYLPGFALLWLLYPSSQRLRRRVLDGFACCALTLTIYIPWLPGLLSQTRHVSRRFWITRPTLRSLEITLCTISGLDPSYLSRLCSRLCFRLLPTGREAIFAVLARPHVKTFVLGGVLLIISCVAAGFWNVSFQRRRKVGSLLSYSLCPVVLAFFYSQGHTPIFLERTFIASAAILPILFATSVGYHSATEKKLLGAFVTIMLVGSAISLVGFFKSFQREDWRGTTEYVARIPQPDRLIVFAPMPGQILFDYYLTRTRARLTRLPEAGLPVNYTFEDPVVPPLRSYPKSELLSPLRAAVDSADFKEIDVVQSHCPSLLCDPLQIYLAAKCSSVSKKEFHEVQAVRCILPTN
jgi:4-amino-4-deoxy-L-arabinose transferase-like glycosyltransferase